MKKNMQITVYSQGTKTLKDGTIAYIGEDARPYVNERVFFVADGMGGSSMYHTEFNKGLFDENTLMDTLFHDIYEDYQNEEFVQYVTDSFFELFAAKEHYFDRNIKKSGYFGSRFITAIILHETLYNRNWNPDELFHRISKNESEDKKNRFLQEFGENIAKKFHEDLCKIAQNANIYYESRIQGLSLLGTTLCATIYREMDDYVEAFYLTAGDSRPYIWSEKMGLCQLLEDQEGHDGGMTNCIRANSPFSIRCNYWSFEKPCILFNASDGCFDSAAFLSPMAFEKLILDETARASSVENIESGFQSFFEEYGRHDDSSTMALKIFGYDSFEDLQKSAERRRSFLQNEYLSKMPDLLEKNYLKNYKKISSELKPKLMELKEQFEVEENVGLFCRQKLKEGKYPPYNERIYEIDNKIHEVTGIIASSRELIRKIIERNYSRFLLLCPQEMSRREQDIIEKIEAAYEKYRIQSMNYDVLIRGHEEELEIAFNDLKVIFEQLREVGIPGSFSDYKDIDYYTVKKVEQIMEDVFSFLNSIKKRKQPAIKGMQKLREEYIQENKKLAENMENELQKICDMLIFGELDIEKVHARILDSDFKELRQELENINDFKPFLSTSFYKEKEKILIECSEAYWNENFVTIIEEIIADPTVRIREDLRSAATAILRDWGHQSREVKKKAEMQEALFKRYEVEYGRYMIGEETCTN